MALEKCILLFFSICIFVQCLHVLATLSKSDRPKKPKPKSSKKPDSRENENHFVSESLDYESLIQGHRSLQLGTGKRFPNAVLSYITPWNSRGYDISKLAADKFTHVSPVWFQINSDEENGCSIGGTHDLDQGWISEVRKNNSQIKIVPRFLFDKFSEGELYNFIRYQNLQDLCMKTVLRYAERNRFDGIVVEIWFKAITTIYQTDVKYHLRNTVINLAEQFNSKKLEFILVVPPLHPGTGVQAFSVEDLEPLLQFVDYFSVMTYDFPSKKPVGVAPIGWVNECIEHLLSLDNPELNRKILMGLNFYGYDYTKSGVKPVVGNEYIEILKKLKPKIYWDESVGEHYIQHNDRKIFYPSQYSILVRLKLAEKLGVGVAIWEIGQGLDHFYNLF